MSDPFARLPLNRATPTLPVHAMKTYGVKAPLSTHWRPAGCKESDCANYRHGWRIHIELIVERRQQGKGELLLEQIKLSGKRFRVVQEGPGKTYWEFEAGQSCFDGDLMRHRVRVGKPELFVVRGGDWRGNPRGEQRVHNNIENWIDDMSEHRDKLLTRLAQG